ncbi:hypothetical protein EYF80_059825 [Liparis tanakae]|uniref:Voltage-gated potassium channel subunit beta-2 n=1 Tax=Liparis tanakae TaxID=230148 RepID=A0A4Z2EMN0_9TELE|nr:hypothetical protein EYF80_059825 [Liparis tanakae]
MFASRGGSGGGKGGKYSVEDLYGISKKPKAAAAAAAKPGGRSGGAKTPDESAESGVLTSQILEAAHRLVERRRLQLYLRECGLSLAECEAERAAMTYK